MMPYGVGMYLAYEFIDHRDKELNHELNYCNLFIEWLSFAGLMAVSFIGAKKYMAFMGAFLYFWQVTYRKIFTICWAVLIRNMILIKPEQTIPWIFPSCFLRSFLSLNLWVPTAVLSYSIYCFHINFLQGFLQMPYFIVKPPKNLTCPITTNEAYQKWTLLVLAGWFSSFFFAMLMYVFVEKPAIDARVAFREVTKVREDTDPQVETQMTPLD
jgi:peptidoglycan/LPS O-acetylase OafA/YrhL